MPMAMVAAVPPAWAPKRAALPVPEAEDAHGDEGGPIPTGRPEGGERLGALGPRTPWVERVDALRQKLRKSHAHFAVEDVGCTPPEWSRVYRMDRHMSDRMVAYLLALHPELSRAYTQELKRRGARRVTRAQPRDRGAGPGDG
jgi:hypothetical protein